MTLTDGGADGGDVIRLKGIDDTSDGVYALFGREYDLVVLCAQVICNLTAKPDISEIENENTNTSLIENMISGKLNALLQSISTID